MNVLLSRLSVRGVLNAAIGTSVAFFLFLALAVPSVFACSMTCHGDLVNYGGGYSVCYGYITMGDSCMSEPNDPGGGGGSPGGGGGGGDVAAVTLDVADGTIAQGASTDLVWYTQYVYSCSIDNGVGSVTANTGGSAPVSPSQTTTYTLSCYNANTNALMTDSASVTVNVPTPPDLVGSVGGARTVTANQSITLYGGVTNSGSSAAGSFPNIVQVCDANCATVNQTLSATTLSSLAPGGWAEVSTTFTPTTASQQYYRVCANYNTGWGNGVTESNYANNCSGWQSLLVSPQPVPPTATLSLWPNSIPYGGNSTVSWGSTNAISCTGTNFSTGGATAGSVSVTATQDTVYTVTCTGAAGSASDAKTLYVGAQPQADLTASMVTAGSPVAGSSASLSSIATNIGNGTSGSFPMLFQVSETGGLTQSSYIAALASGATGSGSASYTFPSAGTYSVRACANYNTSWAAVTTESNYANNCGPWTTVTVSAAPNPQLSCNVSSTSITPGQSVTYNANPSGGATGPYTWVASDGGSHGSASTVSRTLTTPGIYSMNVDTSSTAVSYGPNVSVTATWCTNSSTVLSIAATPNRVRAGQSVALTWSADGLNGEGATCSVSGPGVSWSSAVAAAPVCTASGSANPTINTQSTYTLTCGSQTKSVTVNVIPNFQEF